MHTADTQNRFLEMRAKGLSLARIAHAIGVSKRTLITWNQQHAEQLRAMRAIELEALQEKLLASEKSELTFLATMLSKTEKLLLESELERVSFMNAWRIHAQLRTEIRQRRIAFDFDFSKSTVTEDEPITPSHPNAKPINSDAGAHTEIPAPEPTDSSAPALPSSERSDSTPPAEALLTNHIEPWMS